MVKTSDSEHNGVPSGDLGSIPSTVYLFVFLATRFLAKIAFRASCVLAAPSCQPILHTIQRGGVPAAQVIVH